MDMKQNFVVWKNIVVGTGITIEGFRTFMKENRLYIHDIVESLIAHPDFKLSPTDEEVKLVSVSVEELGFGGGERKTISATFADILCRALEDKGLDTCPQEVVLQLCMQYKVLPQNKPHVVVMDSIPYQTNANMPFLIQVIQSHGGLGLYSATADPNFIWPQDSRFLFRQK